MERTVTTQAELDAALADERVDWRLDELRPISDGGAAKAKAKRVVVPCVEVDIDGKKVSR